MSRKGTWDYGPGLGLYDHNDRKCLYPCLFCVHSVKERKKKKREEKLIQLAEQQMQEKEEMLSNEKEENEMAENGKLVICFIY